MSIRSVSDRDFGFVSDRLLYASEMRRTVARIIMSVLNDPSNVIHRDNGGRDIGLLSAKIFDEYMSSMEDLGALFYGIRNRNPNGIMFHYVNYASSNIGDFFAEVSSWTALPTTMELLGINDTEYQLLRQAHADAGDNPDDVIAHLNAIPAELQNVAEAYRAGFDPGVLGNGVVAPADRSMKLTHNKIKHGVSIVIDASKIVTNSTTTTLGPEFHDKLLTLIQVPNAVEAQSGKEPLLTSLPVTPAVIGSLFQGLDSITNIANAVLSTVWVLLQERIWVY